MKKYFTIFQISLQNEFVYRFNFLLWRLRNLLRFLMTFFLWKGIFSSNTTVFGYDLQQIVTYVFLVLIIQTFIIAAPSSDSIGGEIGNGDLSNFLVKPLGYLKYWFTRDLASKFLNIIFAIFEVGVLFFILKPNLYFSMGLENLLGFGIGAALAVGIYYLLSSASRFLAFWNPENTWGLAFVIFVLVDILAGGTFPLNILPSWIYNLLQLTPFPYLIYFPISILLGKITGFEMWRVIGQSMVWLVLMLLFTKLVWKKGLVVYQSSGR